MNKLVSIVLPTYNGERFIRESIESILKQTYTNWELIIVNDCSSDDTLKIAEEYAKKDSRINVITNSMNQKLPATLNVGFARAKGDYYTWTSDDNMYRKDALEIMVNYLEKNKNIDLVSCNINFVSEDGAFLYTLSERTERKSILELLKKCNVGACFMYTKKIAQKVGEYDVNMFCAEDYDYWCRLALVGNIKYLKECPYYYKVNPQSLTATKQDVIQEKCKEIQLKYAISIMKKINLPIRKQIEFLMDKYRVTKRKEWLELAQNLDLRLANSYLKKIQIAGNKAEIKYLKKVNFKKQLSILNKTLKDKKILIYGAGILFDAAYNKYDFSNLNIIGISDKKFENENSPKEFLGIKTYAPDEISSLDIDCILISLKEYYSILNIFQMQFKNIQVLPLVEKNIESSIERRLINHNIWIELNGLHGKKRQKYSKIKLLKTQLCNKLNYYTGKIDIPQIEFTLTTKCTLRCKHCCNFIPEIKTEEHCLISFDDFKVQVDNLLNAVNSVKNFLLIGGEPLLVKDLHKYLDYVASKKKIKRVWIVTNGTLLMKDELIKVAKKYRKKTTIWISNYSKNEDLKNKLHHSELIGQINNANLDYDYKKDLNWGYTSPIGKNKKRDGQKEYFKYCNNHCVAVFGGKIYVCPRAGVFDIKGIYTPDEEEVINLNVENNSKILKQKLIKFYSRDYFSACDYCVVLEDRTEPSVIPAIQIKN